MVHEEKTKEEVITKINTIVHYLPKKRNKKKKKEDTAQSTKLTSEQRGESQKSSANKE